MAEAPRTELIDDPYTLEEAARLPLTAGEAVDALLDRARQGARVARALSLEERRALCARAVERMEASAEAIAADVTRMVGKPLRQARGEVAGMAKRARHMIAIAEAALTGEVIPEPEAPTGAEGAGAGRPTRWIAREPHGVVFDLPAWNYPLLTAVNVLVPALLAGNAVLLKHSSRSGLVGDHFARAFSEAGADPRLVQSFHCDHPTAERVAADRRVDHVAFTGSVHGGHRIYAAVASSHFADVGLELGGKDGAYVAPDADLDEAVRGLVDGAFYNAGQSCCAAERIYVHRSHYARFVDAAIELARAYRLGDPKRDDVTMGPMAQPNQPAFLSAQIEQARAMGAEIPLGGRPLRVEGKGRFFEPTVVLGATHAMDLMRVESFGPVMPIVPVDSDEEAIRLINDSDLGLTASVWTRDLERAARIGAALEVGTVTANQCDTVDPALPWVGVKDSGKGSTLSRLGFLHLTRPKAYNFKRV